MPKISVVIPLYNKEKHIKETLNSILAQTFEDFEVIVVNDGSTDDSATVVEGFEDQRIHLFQIENQGVSHARNYGIEKSSAHLIAFLDADDYWYDHHLRDLMDLYDAFPGCGLYATAYKVEKKERILIPEFKGISHTSFQMGIVDDYFYSSMVNAIALTSAVMIPKVMTESLGGFDENITLGAGEDTDLWMRIALQQKVAFNHTISVIYNMKATNRISNSNTNKRKFIDLDQYEPQAKTNQSLKKYLDLNRFSIGLQYKLVNNPNIAMEYFNKIDRNNLNKKQQVLIYMPPTVLKFLSRFQNLMRYLNINLSAFK